VTLLGRIAARAEIPHDTVKYHQPEKWYVVIKHSASTASENRKLNPKPEAWWCDRGTAPVTPGRPLGRFSSCRHFLS